MAGISIKTNFDLGANLPIDSRLVAESLTSLYNAGYNENNSYVGMLVYVTEEDAYYKLSGYDTTSGTASTDECWDQLAALEGTTFTEEDRAKLDGIEEGANNYVHPESGVTAGTYRSVTVDEQGHVTAGTNPTTLDEYGITEVEAEKITGTISIENLPQGALERLVIVEDDNARFALTVDDVQAGDTVKVSSTGIMYFVKDTDNLDNEDGYEEYTAGTATSVAWSGITDKPDTYTPSEHTHTVSEITDFPDSLKNPEKLTVTVDGTATEYDGSEAVSLSISYDEELSDESTNAVQNKVLKAYLDSLQESIGSSEIMLSDIQYIPEHTFAEWVQNCPVHIDDDAFPFLAFLNSYYGENIETISIPDPNGSTGSVSNTLTVGYICGESGTMYWHLSEYDFTESDVPVKDYTDKINRIYMFTTPDNNVDDNIKIGDYSFYGCNNIAEISIPEGCFTISDNAFAGINSDCVIILHSPKDSISGSPWGFENPDNIYWVKPATKVKSLTLNVNGEETVFDGTEAMEVNIEAITEEEIDEMMNEIFS